MAQEKNTVNEQESSKIGTVKIADDVVAMIAAFAAMEVDGVASMAGGVDTEALSKGGMKKLGRSVRVEVSKDGVRADLSVVMKYGYNLPETSSKVQARVGTAIENMTGLAVLDVNIHIVGIEIQE